MVTVSIGMGNFGIGLVTEAETGERSPVWQ